MVAVRRIAYGFAYFLKFALVLNPTFKMYAAKRINY